MPKKIMLVGPPRLQTAVCMALREYAEAAYPPGGSECAQVARAALMDAALDLESGFAATGSHAELSRRLRGNTKAAIQYFCEQHDQADLLPWLERFISGQEIGEQELLNGYPD